MSKKQEKEEVKCETRASIIVHFAGNAIELTVEEARELRDCLNETLTEQPHIVYDYPFSPPVWEDWRRYENPFKYTWS